MIIINQVNILFITTYLSSVQHALLLFYENPITILYKNVNSSSYVMR
jgi:hypothetical protein